MRRRRSRWTPSHGDAERSGVGRRRIRGESPTLRRARILHWFRKDLRLDDNTALSEAARDSNGDVVPFYVSESALLARPDIAPARVRFVLGALESLDQALLARGSSLACSHGEAASQVLAAARAADADAVYGNDEYEPSLRTRDDAVDRTLRDAGAQGMRFDADGACVKRWCSELARVPAEGLHRPWAAPPLLLASCGVVLGWTWPHPIVDHAEQRERALGILGLGSFDSIFAAAFSLGFHT